MARIILIVDDEIEDEFYIQLSEFIENFWGVEPGRIRIEREGGP